MLMEEEPIFYFKSYINYHFMAFDDGHVEMHVNKKFLYNY
jgi:hypothetical protein